MRTDPGVANERTALAWGRFALSLLAVGALMLHAALDARVRPVQLAVAIVLGAAAAWADHQGHRLYGARADGQAAGAQASPAVLGAMSGVTALAAVATFLHACGWA